jgi:trans-2,3-dihydro-3-hydroxyanthranilate isomerase
VEPETSDAAALYYRGRFYRPRLRRQSAGGGAGRRRALDRAEQAIALEFNYSETTFVLPPRDAANDAQVRIFTVRSEIPFAGHPNVGTAFVLATQVAKPPARFLFEEGAGLVPVEILKQDGRVVGAELTAPQPLSKLKQFSAEQAAACISLSAADIRTDRHPTQIVSVALPFLVAELTSREALRRARADSS